jgi:hypothetical protein
MNAYLNRFFRKPASDKPSITSLSQEVVFFIVILCLASMEIGTYLAKPSSDRSSSALNLVIVSMLLLNWLASQFSWSPRTAAGLRLASFGWTLVASVVVVWYWMPR